MADCIFCKIVSGDIPSTKIYENDDVLAFLDIAPMAPVHIVVIPKKHIMESVFDVNCENSQIIARCFEAIAVIAREQKLEVGFRVVTNSGSDAGQSVPHLHFHILGGKKLPLNLA